MAGQKTGQFSINLGGHTEQTIIVGSASPLLLPEMAEIALPRYPLDDAFEDGEPDLFRILRWDYGLVEALYGRDAEMQAILSWAKTDSSAATARLITGEGGAGKTRLAAAVARSLRNEGWTAGFLQNAGLKLADYEKQGLLIVLDYTEEQRERTRDLLETLAAWRNGPYPIRLLLLSRRSFEDWEGEADILEGRFGRRPIAAPGPLALNDALALVAESAVCFSHKAGRPLPDLAGSVQWLKQSATHRLPLLAMAAAVHAVLVPGQAFGLGGGDLLKQLAKREQRRVRRVSNSIGLGEDGLARLLALAVLADGLGAPAIRQLATAGVIPVPADDVIDTLNGTPWCCNAYVMRLQPDLLAAAFLDQVLFSSHVAIRPDALPDWLFIALLDGVANLGDRMSRLFYDLMSLGRETEERHPLENCLAEMLQRDPSRADSFRPVVFQRVSHWSAGFAVTVANTLVERSSNKPMQGSLIGNVARHLSEIGHWDEALVAAQAAVDLFRGSVSSESDIHVPNLAISLNNLGAALMNRGRWQDAVVPVEEAVQIYRRLSRSDADAVAPDLATSLTNLGTILGNLGHWKEARMVAQEAVKLYRDLASLWPESFVADLAMSLDNLGTVFGSIGQWGDALTVIEEAAELYRELATARPDVFAPMLARSLSNLAPCLRELDRQEDALERAEEAVELFRDLARVRPDAFVPSLARSLNNLVAMYENLGRWEDALLLAGEAVSLQRVIVRVQSEANALDLASSLNDLARHLRALGRKSDALTTAEEAMRILLPSLSRFPENTISSMAVVSRMAAVARGYLLTCAEAEKEPDEEFLQETCGLLSAFQYNS